MRALKPFSDIWDVGISITTFFFAIFRFRQILGCNGSKASGNTIIGTIASLLWFNIGQ